MAYIIEDDFRSAGVKWYTRELVLSDEIDDAHIAEAIQAASDEIDERTNDHFEVENTLTVTIDTYDPSTRVYLPKRIRTVTNAKTVASDGTETVEDAANYRVHSSLDAAGETALGRFDWLEIISGRSISTGEFWPLGTGVVKVTGNWSWAVTPERIKLATALLVWDHFAERGDVLMRARSLPTEYGNVPLDDIPTAVSRIVESFRRFDLVML